jgi:hypothetical protein
MAWSSAARWRGGGTSDPTKNARRSQLLGFGYTDPSIRFLIQKFHRVGPATTPASNGLWVGEPETGESAELAGLGQELVLSDPGLDSKCETQVASARSSRHPSRSFPLALRSFSRRRAAPVRSGSDAASERR